MSTIDVSSVNHVVSGDASRVDGRRKWRTRIPEEGNRYGRLTVIRAAPSVRNRSRWVCRCDCGNEVTTYGDTIRRGESRSCGCIRRARRKPFEWNANPDGNTFRFAVDSKRHGRAYATAPMEFLDRISRVNWNLELGRSRADGRNLMVSGDGDRLHRLIWEWAGRRPVAQIDHVDGNPLNNALGNLRDGSGSVNARNCIALRRDNKTGYRGVHKKKSGRWVGYVVANRKMNWVAGSFATSEEAARARDNLAVSLHGSTAILNFPRRQAEEPKAEGKSTARELEDAGKADR